MELDELKSLWQTNDAKLERSLQLNEQNIELIQSQKVVSKLAPLYRQRLVECVFHAVAILLLIAFILTNITELPYSLSGIGLLAFYITTLVNAIRQINLVKEMDFNKDLATMQSSLVKLQTHIINYAKLSVLFIPSFLAYPVIITKLVKDFNIQFFGEFDIIQKSNGSWWTMMIVVSAILIPLGIWFYRAVSYKNIDKRFVKRFIEKSSGKRVTQALEFLKELQDMKHNTH
jgi:hypothetical protein